jgi:RF-1 domain
MADFRDISDDQLLRECKLDVFRGSGPGGQKRNKTSSAVRLTHVPSGVCATASEFRSQAQNRAAALKRLRHHMALAFRRTFVVQPSANLDVSMRSEEYLGIMGWILDALAESGWSISAGAKLVGVSTGQLSAFLRRDEKLWGHVNQERKKVGLRGLV